MKVKMTPEEFQSFKAWLEFQMDYDAETETLDYEQDVLDLAIDRFLDSMGR